MSGQPFVQRRVPIIDKIELERPAGVSVQVGAELAASAAGHLAEHVVVDDIPHLTHVEERIQVDGIPISAAELTELMEAVAPAVRAMESDGWAPPTFFEIGTAIGDLGL